MADSSPSSERSSVPLMHIPSTRTMGRKEGGRVGEEVGGGREGGGRESEEGRGEGGRGRDGEEGREK